MRPLLALLALAALGCGPPVASPPTYTMRDAGVDAPDVPDVFVPEGCDARVQSSMLGILCRGDAASMGTSPAIPVQGGVCVSPANGFNCGACGNLCEDGRTCLDNPQGSNTGWRCRFPMAR